ncbi:hypothetical protein MBAV_005159, partial [Candidatus Magnetobacterium bavaricum]
MEAYDIHCYLLKCIMDNLEIFNKDGFPNNSNYAKQEIQTALELMESMVHPKVCKVIPNILNRLDETIQYLKIAEDVYMKLSMKVSDTNALNAICMAWQF